MIAIQRDLMVRWHRAYLRRCPTCNSLRSKLVLVGVDGTMKNVCKNAWFDIRGHRRCVNWFKRRCDMEKMPTQLTTVPRRRSLKIKVNPCIVYHHPYCDNTTYSILLYTLIQLLLCMHLLLHHMHFCIGGLMSKMWILTLQLRALVAVAYSSDFFDLIGEA